MLCVQVRSLDTQLHPERLKVITQQVEEEQAVLQSQALLRLQQIHAADRQTHSPQVSMCVLVWVRVRVEAGGAAHLQPESVRVCHTALAHGT